jgi:hypothetical protein
MVMLKAWLKNQLIYAYRANSNISQFNVTRK